MRFVLPIPESVASTVIAAVHVWVVLRANVHAKPLRRYKTCVVRVPSQAIVVVPTISVCVCKKEIAVRKIVPRAGVVPMATAVRM